MWRQITRRLYPERPDEEVPMAPAWGVDLLYAGPDGEIAEPPGYVSDGALDELFRTRGKSFSTISAFQRKWYYFEDRHVAPGVTLPPWQSAGRVHPPRPLSHSLGDSGQDWDTLEATLDLLLSEGGLGRGSSDGDKVRILATGIHERFRGGGPRNHPADVALRTSWCLGASNLFVAMLGILGIPARGVGMSEHSVSEVWLDGGWRMVENSHNWITRPPESACVLNAGHAALICDPSHDIFAALSPFHRGIYYHFGHGHFGMPDARWTRETLVNYCPATAGALYPETAGRRFKTLQPTRHEVLSRFGSHPHYLAEQRAAGLSWLASEESAWQVVLEPGSKVRESLWMGDLDGVLGVDWSILLDADSGTQFAVEVNGQKLESLATSIERSDPVTKRMTCCAQLAAEYFLAHAWNELVLLNNGKSAIRLALAFDPWLKPAKVAGNFCTA